MGANLPSVDLGAGRTAVAVSLGAQHTCALLVRLPNGRLGGLGQQNGAIEPHTLMLSTPERTEGGMEGEKTPNLSLRQAQTDIPIRHTKLKVDCVRQPARADFNTYRAHPDQMARGGLVLDSVLTLNTCQSTRISGL